MAYDISKLFGNYYAGSNSNSLYSSLSDYSSIKSGAYKRLVSAYYDKDSTGKVNSSSKTDKVQKQIEARNTKAYTEIKSDADSLSNSALKLTDTTSKSLFKSADSVTDDMVSAVKDYIKNYNNLLDSSKESTNSSVSSKVSNLTAQTNAFSKRLSDIGITIESDKSLTLNEETIKKAEVSKVKDVFNGSNSLAFQTMTRANSIGQSAKLAGSGNSLYGSGGTFESNAYNSSYDWYL